MKYLTLLFVGLFVFVSAPVQAEEITMICYEGTEYRDIYKYVNPMIGRKKVLRRVDGEWKDWDKTGTSDFISRKLKIKDRGATLKYISENEYALEDESYQGFWDLKLKVGDKIKVHEEYVLDFEFPRTTYYRYFTNWEGSLRSLLGVIYKKDNCTKYNPSSSGKN